MKLDESTVRRAQDRSGGLKDDRDSQIDEILDSDCLGHQSGDPLVGDNYDSYPHFSDLSQPKWMSFIRDLFSHKLVKDYSDARKELTGVTGDPMADKWEDSLEKAAELFNIDAEKLFNQGSTVSTDSKLTQILEYEPADSLKECKNPLLVAQLYLKGLSVEEIEELLEGDSRQARDSLKAVGLLEGDTQEEQQTAFENNDGSLGGVTIDTTNL